MFCQIADLVVEIPEAGGLASRCRDYQIQENLPADITIREELYRVENYPNLTYNQAVYLASGFQFYRRLLQFNGMMLHASAVAVDGRAYLFSGPCGMGKSTHTKLWQQRFGEGAVVFNDDKPALRRIDGVWYAYGTPWCGKDGINKNMKVPVAGICFLKRGEQNAIRRLSDRDACFSVISQTTRRFKTSEQLSEMLTLAEQLVREVPVFELKNKPELEAARLSYETMSREARR